MSIWKHKVEKKSIWIKTCCFCPLLFCPLSLRVNLQTILTIIQEGLEGKRREEMFPEGILPYMCTLWCLKSSLYLIHVSQ